ncbi:MAG: hydantoinase B/oxoprolinase family protein [Woeseiaceae bacterium]|nr:hydantoinase B/oxoprolinase family protein [Woeseiaceae bacterium]
MSGNAWQFWVDRGGTFTDVVALRPDGSLETLKLLSDNPAHYADAAAEGMRRALSGWRESGGREAAVAAVKMGTTVATNALLERRGSRCALLVTAGFEDALAIGYQNRPDIFALRIVKPEPLYERVAGITERLGVDGEVVTPLNEDDARAQLEDIYARGIRAVAICLLHGFRYPQHEARLAELARDAGFTQVSVSHEVEPLIKFISRAETSLADAYLTPVLRRYIDQLEAALVDVAEPSRLMFMQSGGGLITARHFRGKDSILSGPAGGVVGMVEAARAAGLERLVGLDMGGTSTDVSAWSGEYERSDETEIAGIRLRAPMMKIHTIAAGGGSILRYADERFQVGPASAGADPGPRCYRRDGPLAVTDANVLLGRIPVAFFPAVFGPDGDQPLDTDAVRDAFEQLAQDIGTDRDTPPSPEDVAAGFLTVAVESMANAIRKITIERGEDVRDFTLCCFGGAGGQHACRIADVLGIRRIWLHPLAGVLSAYGMGLADIRIERQQTVERPLDDDELAALDEPIRTLSDACAAALDDQDVPASRRAFHVRCGLRVSGSDTELDVAHGEAAAMRADFDRAYRARFGADRGAGDLLIATLRVTAIGSEHAVPATAPDAGDPATPAAQARMWTAGGWRDVPVYRRSELTATTAIDGPAIVAEDNGTTVIDEGWRGTLNELGHLLLDRTGQSGGPVDTQEDDHERPDPVRLEVFNRLFMNIAEQMGTVLRMTALSVNIRERLDFSCALFDSDGNLVSNAPHMPVHLGSMGESVRSVIASHGSRLADGDAVMLNSPYNGGTHLPDITVVSPWFGGGERPRFYVASRAHHADVGGITPGSMPARSRHIDEEGVLIDNVLLIERGEFRERAVRDLFAGARWPGRNIDQNIADLRAQTAANRQGMRQLDRAIERYGLDTVERYLRFVRENATSSVRRLLGTLRDGRFDYELDSGERIRVAVTLGDDASTACVDFAGTSPQSDSNFNAPEAVTRAAVLYVFRSLIEEAIPMNEGCLVPLTVRIPEGCLLSPVYPAAVVAGNVETSQCVTDALYGALNALAASQGTMNNLSFGNAEYQYYETIAGGAGAGPEWDGADAVQTHMTNSRLTDTEVLEQACPVRVDRFAIRRGSGGEGRHRGGDGIVRQIRFLTEAEVTILSNHRRIAPFGLEGGGAGATGRNVVCRGDGTEEALAATETVAVGAGDAVRIETPGGGGFG